MLPLSSSIGINSNERGYYRAVDVSNLVTVVTVMTALDLI